MGAAGSLVPYAPLFSARAVGAAAGVAPDHVWFVQPSKDAVGQTNPWDQAHAAFQHYQSLGGTPVAYIEPDLIYNYPFDRNNGSPGLSLAAAATPCTQDPPNRNWPTKPDFAWHKGPLYTGLAAAAARLGTITDGNRVRIVHLDTGYSRGHATLPPNLNLGLQKNFVEGSNDAADPGVQGFLKNPGHGTGTIGILAGNTVTVGSYIDFLGGAPFADVVPVRVASSVVEFYNSTIAQGYNYATSIGADVVTLSMGGVPTQAWADAINQAYEAGVAMFAAAGNNYSGLPTRNIVYPARFNRVVAVCGATADYGPYKKDFPSTEMQGNFGPSQKMGTAIAAFTPNIPWAQWGCPNTIDLDGAGTSAATPQAAAAAAIWLQFNRATLSGPDFTGANAWRKVEALRLALFATADKSKPNSNDYFGQGLLNAAAALEVVPSINVNKTPQDEVSFPWIKILFGVGVAPSPANQMMATELTQLIIGSPDFSTEFAQIGYEDAQVDSNTLKSLIDAVLKSNDASQTLKTYLAARRSTL